MIHIMLPPQYSSRTGVNVAEPHKRLMAAVLQAVVDDCRGSVYRRSAGKGALDARTVLKAIAYVASRDRAWPFSFENLCEALGLDAGGLREELDVMRGPETSHAAPSSTPCHGVRARCSASGAVRS